MSNVRIGLAPFDRSIMAFEENGDTTDVLADIARTLYFMIGPNKQAKIDLSDGSSITIAIVAASGFKNANPDH